MRDGDDAVLGGPPRNPLAGLTMGRIVHVVMAGRLDGDGLRSSDYHRPAIVTNVNSAGNINATVFLDGPNDVPEGAYTGPVWINNLSYDDNEKRAGTWHWIERAD